MIINPIVKIIRAKKIGVLLRDARLNSGKSVEECAELLGVSAEEYASMERGERPPTLPELEIFAYYMELPLDHFWGSKVLDTSGVERTIDAAEIKELRQNAIGSLIRKARIESSLSVEELGGNAGIEPNLLESYEEGETAIPLPDLEMLSRVLSTSLSDYENQSGQVGSWFSEQSNTREFLALPKELQEFIGKPINRPYLELAVRLSEMKVERLRALAEGLLEITL